MMKKLLILGVIVVFLLGGCEELKELYGIQPVGEEEYVPLEDIQVEEEFEEITDLPPQVPEDEVLEVEELEELDELEELEEVEGVEELEEIEEIVEDEIEEISEEEITEEVEEELVEEKPKKDLKVLIVEETEMVSLNPKAADPDADQLSFTYTTPLGVDGKWETGYGDAGEYTVIVTASDGELSATKEILIIVNKKEEIPVIDEAAPMEKELETKENSKLSFGVQASDLNEDVLTFTWTIDDEEVSTEGNSYVYDVDYNAAGEHVVGVIVSDGVNDVSEEWGVVVENVNRKPILDAISPISVKETGIVVIEPRAVDSDDDELVFSIDNAGFGQMDGKFEWETTYDDAGEYDITLTVSDGEDEVSQSVKVMVENVNRPPVFEDITLG